jgi:hypothetical protein
MTRPQVGDIWEDAVKGPVLILEVLGSRAAEGTEYDVTVLNLTSGQTVTDWYIGLYDKKLA